MKLALICTCILVLVTARLVYGENESHVIFDPEISAFLATLEPYQLTKNEVVFVLDESGSIGLDRYAEVKYFTELVSRRLLVSQMHSRIAIISFSDASRTKVNYIKNSHESSKCNLMKIIRNLYYARGGTETSVAMEAARQILRQSREDSNKIIILITDGQSNSGYSPVGISNILKKENVTIFAVGVAEVNEGEVNDVATSKAHVYILKSFDKIKKLNAYLVKETKEVRYEYVEDSSLCDDNCSNKTNCCDDHAACYCGAIGGNYQCTCDPGFYGTGLHCYVCPKGTYKNEKENTGSCKLCPEHATTLEVGSKSEEDCICELGFTKHGNQCKAIECMKLQAPDGGILIPMNCSNLYGSQCSVKCKEGYCPYSCSFSKSTQTSHILPWNHLPLQSRNCLPTGNWTGEDFRCERIKCPALDQPLFGKHNCSTPDFDYGTVCNFTCGNGYELFGSNIRHCQTDGSWTGSQTHCKEIHCKPLKHNANLIVKPKHCSQKPQPYRSVCRFYCTEGYTLISQYGKSSGFYECLANKTWSNATHEISCADVSPPNIKCPPFIVTYTDNEKSTATLNWTEPVAEDNVFISSVSIVYPPHIRKQPYAFPIGTTKIEYIAYDSVNLNSTCSFTVTVKDNEPPKILYCPEDIEQYNAKKDPIKIFWNEPKFSDNSGLLTSIFHNKASGDQFGWGPEQTVYYNASDASGNVASCRFTVKVKHFPCPTLEPPENGYRTCDSWMEGQLCSVFCHKGYEFANKKEVPRTYKCNQKNSNRYKSGTWVPFPFQSNYKIPVPDCIRREKRSAEQETYQIKVEVNKCNDTVMEEMRQAFISHIRPLEKVFKGMICPADKGCRPENVNVTCKTVHQKIKRSISLSQSKAVLTFSFNITLHQSRNGSAGPLTKNKIPPKGRHSSSDVILRKLVPNVIKSVKNIYNTTDVKFSNLNHYVDFICSVGQISINGSCFNCPAGTFKDDFTEKCEDCPRASYQDKEKRISCLPCPKDYTTYKMGSKSIKDCKAPCQPGTYSKTTFEPCYPCPFNTYQEYFNGKDCIKCTKGLLTWKVGSNSSKDCLSPCPPGSYSDTGLEPCNVCDFGFYQSLSQQKLCEACPDGTSTSSKGSLDKNQCKKINFCENAPCSSLSTCHSHAHGYTCVCAYGFIGKHCEQEMDFCQSDPCFNNGTCVNEPGGYKCICPTGITGVNCEVNVDDCAQNSCYNGGICIDLIDSYKCQCPLGFTGAQCELNINDCINNTCQNGGTCFDKVNGYKCCCPTDYFGDHCEFKKKFCDVLCHNGGVCILNNTGTFCDCKAGYQGKHCETEINPCDKHTCYNSGKCIVVNGEATCKCPLMYTGVHCEKDAVPEYSLRFPTPETSNYVELRNSEILYAITVSFFMRTSNTGSNSYPTVISYAYYDKENDVLVDNGLTLFDMNKVILYLHGTMLHTGYIANSDTKWHHYAVTWERKYGKWSFFVDGETIVNGENVGEEQFLWPGIFILGQEQDSLGGTFNSLESFVGEITEFNVWDYALTESEIKLISSSCGKMGNVIPWITAANHIYGSIDISKDVNLCKDIGRCTEDDCFCLNKSKMDDNTCKHLVKNCFPNACENGHLCKKIDSAEFCACSSGYGGKHCEYELNECLINNGGCSHACINNNGSYKCECPDDMRLSEDGLTCKETSFCRDKEQVYLDGESWESNCHTCVCNLGAVECQKIHCLPLRCHPAETLSHTPGECCPKCMMYEFYCSGSLNGVLSIVEAMEHVAENQLTLAEDCLAEAFSDDLFSVRYEFVENNTRGNLLVYQDCQKFNVSQSGMLLYNGESFTLPFQNDLITIQSNREIELTTRSLHVTWSINNYISIATATKQLCGLCTIVRNNKYNSEF